MAYSACLNNDYKMTSMKKILSLGLSFVFCMLSLCPLSLSARQLPDPHFENWSKTYNGDAQLSDWNGSNVTQVGLKFTFMYQKPGRTGSCLFVTDRTIGAIGITATGPGYASLGVPFQYMKGLTIRSATAGTEGGIAWTNRPDTMSVWVKRTGDNTDKEDFHLLYYAWSGTAKGSHYKNKVGGCTATERINEESDIRQRTDGNECTTVDHVTQVAEGWYRARAKYNEWTLIKVPVFYCSDSRPTMCNVIFSAGNYPAFRANDGLYDKNALWVDDVELIYSSKIDRLLINGVEWKGFDPNSEKLQTCKLSDLQTASNPQTISIVALRGIGSLTNIKGETATFEGRRLDSKEMTITPGELNGKPWIITVRADDGSSTHTYKLKIQN